MKLERLSHSQTGVWSSCETAWDYGYRQRIVSKVGRTYYDLGTLVHELCAVYDQNLKIGIPAGSDIAWDRVRQYAVDTWWSNKDAMSNMNMVTLFNRAMSCVKKYVLEFSGKVDKGCTIEDIEDYFELPIVTPKGRSITIEGYIDRTHIDINGKRVLMDRKTSSQGRHRSDNQMMIDPQLSLYAAAYREMGKPVDIIAIDSMSTYPYKNYDSEPADKLFKRLFARRSNAELDFVLANYGLTADKIADVAETDGPFTRNLSYDCPRCQYFELCLYTAKGIDTSALIASQFKSKDENDTAKEIDPGPESP